MWPVIWPAAANIDSVDEFPRRMAELYAGASLAALTLQRVGGDPVTIMPATLPRVDGWYGYRDLIGTFYPEVYPAAADLKRWSDFFRTEAIQLPGPVASILEVRVNNEILDPATWRVENGTWLLRLDGEDWPQDLSGAFTVTYHNTYPVDEMGQYAAGVLAHEFLKLLTGDRKCRLPSTVTNVSRQGMTYDIVRGMFPDGVTGLPEVDTYVMLWNPHGLKTKPMVFSPDLDRHRQVTFP